MLVSLMWRVRINSSFKKRRKRNESRDLFQDYDLCISDHNRHPVAIVVAEG